MTPVFDAALQLSQVFLLFVLVVQNFDLRARLKSIEEKLAPEKSSGT